jgi:CBS domain-containing protein
MRRIVRAGRKARRIIRAADTYLPRDAAGIRSIKVDPRRRLIKESAPMTVSIFMERGEVIQARTEDTVASVVALLAEKRIGCVPVVENGKVVGIFSERDVLYGLARVGAALLDMELGEVMTTPAVTIEPDTPILSALSLMTRRRMRHLPIVEGERMVGFVSIGDLVKSRIHRIESEAEAMRSYIQSA